jgi:regulator of replication initiation timing
MDQHQIEYLENRIQDLQINLEETDKVLRASVARNSKLLIEIEQLQKVQSDVLAALELSMGYLTEFGEPAIDDSNKKWNAYDAVINALQAVLPKPDESISDQQEEE